MERFHIGEGLIILWQGLIFQFSGRTGPTIKFKEAGGSETLKIDEQQFWCEVEQHEIAVMARALQDPVRLPVAPSVHHEDHSASAVMYAPRHLGKTERLFGATSERFHVASPRGNLVHIKLITNVIRDHLADLRQIPITHVYAARYLPALMRLNTEHAQTGIEALKPISLRAFRRRVAAFSRMYHNPVLRSNHPKHEACGTRVAAAPHERLGVQPGRSNEFPNEHTHRNVLLVPAGQLRLTAVVDRYSGCVLALRMRFVKPSPNSNPR